MKINSLINIIHGYVRGFLDFRKLPVAPSNPTSNEVRIYSKTGSNALFLRDSSGNETKLSFQWQTESFDVDATLASSKVVNLANIPISESEFVFLNGIKCIKGVGKNYQLSGTTITFDAAEILSIGDVIEIKYMI